MTGSMGLPVGTQVDDPVMTATGVPPAITRTAPLMNCPVTQGGVDVVASEHAAIT